MNILLISLLLAAYAVSASKVELKTREIVHLELHKPGSVAINGIKYRESSGTTSNSQYTVSLNPGSYNFGEATHKIVSGREVQNVNPIKVGNMLSAIMINKYKPNVLGECIFVLHKDSIVGISYHVELWEKQGCQQKTNNPEDLQISIMIDGEITDTVTGNSINGFRTIILKKGFHDIKLLATNTGSGLWGSFPSLGNGFATGRYLFVWQNPIEQHEETLQSLPPEKIAEPIKVLKPKRTKTLYDVIVGIPKLETKSNRTVIDNISDGIITDGFTGVTLVHSHTFPSIWSM